MAEQAVALCGGGVAGRPPLVHRDVEHQHPRLRVPIRHLVLDEVAKDDRTGREHVGEHRVLRGDEHPARDPHVRAPGAVHVHRHDHPVERQPGRHRLPVTRDALMERLVVHPGLTRNVRRHVEQLEGLAYAQPQHGLGRERRIPQAPVARSGHLGVAFIVLLVCMPIHHIFFVMGMYLRM
eukprot:464104-Hanusia_phi.AAC.2